MEKKRLVHQLDTPFTEVRWPSVLQEDQDTILEILCSVLTPIGQHRRSFVTASKGKASKSRKRKHRDESQADRIAPEAPEISKSIYVGLRNITRKLEEAASHDLAVIFVARSEQASVFHNHFPQMVGAASRHRSEPIRLVGFSKSSEERLSTCLGIPRVSCIAMTEAPKSKALVDLVRKLVPTVIISWLGESKDGQFLETKINAVNTMVGEPRQKKCMKK